MTGIPCPTCGMTRGVASLLHGDPRGAFLFNPLGMIILLGMAAYLIYVVIVVTARLPRIRCEAISSSQAYYFRCLAVLLIAGNWMYLLLHEKIIHDL